MSKQYVLLRHDEKHGLVAMIEKSFSMSWSKSHACVWRNPPRHYMQKGYFIARVGSKNCPIKIDNDKKARIKTNKPFKVK